MNLQKLFFTAAPIALIAIPGYSIWNMYETGQIGECRQDFAIQMAKDIGAADDWVFGLYDAYSAKLDLSVWFFDDQNSLGVAKGQQVRPGDGGMQPNCKGLVYEAFSPALNEHKRKIREHTMPWLTPMPKP
jgi:hypothetical protein